MTNPLLTSHILPPFSAIAAEQVTPAISELIEQGRAQRAQLLADLTSPSWGNLVAPLEEQGDKLDQAWAPVSHLNSVANSDELRKAYTESVALLTDYSTEFSQNEALYKAYQQLADSDEFAQLTQAQQQTQAHQHNDINSVHRQEPDGFRQNNNKREQANDKINERFLIGTPNQNPFMTSTSYFDDIEVQLNYLTPQKGDI